VTCRDVLPGGAQGFDLPTVRELENAVSSSAANNFVDAVKKCMPSMFLLFRRKPSIFLLAATFLARYMVAT
jgi:hypothetical protein